jgi:cytochrome c-type biogenesis protein CcmE
MTKVKAKHQRLVLLAIAMAALITGIAPDLFQEGSGVVAEGHLGQDGTFIAERLLAKHDEKYVPREMKDMTTAQAKQVVSETK